MKHNIRLVIASALLVPALVAIPASAQSTTTVQTQTTNENTTTTSTTDATARQKRLEQRKVDRKTRLTTAEQKRLADRCKGAQGKLSSLQGRIKGTETSRAQVYDNLLARLTKVQERATAAGVDDATLAAALTELETKIATFKTDLETYKVTVTDLAAMDCSADPTAFKASLETARSAREKVMTDAKDIKAFVNGDIKAALKTVKSSLASQAGSKPEVTQ